MITKSGPGMTLIYLLVIPLFLVDPGFAGGCRIDHRDAGGRRVLSLGPRRLRRFLGILAGWWNWCASFLLGAV